MVGDYGVTGIAIPESIDRLHDLLGEVRRIIQSGNVVEHGRPTG